MYAVEDKKPCTFFEYRYVLSFNTLALQ